MVALYCVLAGLGVGVLVLVGVEPVTASARPVFVRVVGATTLVGLPAGYAAACIGPPSGRWERSLTAGVGAWLATLLLPLWFQHRLIIAVPYLWFLPAFAFGGAFACLDSSDDSSHGRESASAQADNSISGGTKGPRLVLKRRGVLLVLAIACAWCAVPVFSSMRASSRRARCEGNLKRIYKAIQAYRQQWNGGYPLVLTHRVPASGSHGVPLTGLYPKYVDDPAVFLCPDDPYKGRLLANTEREIPLSYDYYRPGLKLKRVSKTIVQCTGDHRRSKSPWERCRLGILPNGQIVEVPSNAE